MAHSKLSKTFKLPGFIGNALFHDDKVQRLLHDFQVRQIELELQNRKLQEACIEMEASRNRYAGLYDFAPVAYITLDDKKTIREVNLTAAAMLGMERTELLGITFGSLVNKSDLNILRKHLSNCQRSDGTQTSEEITLALKDGRSMAVELHSVGMWDADRELWGYRTVLVNTSTGKQIREEMQESSEEYYRILSEWISDFVFSFRIDPGGAVTLEWITEAFSRITGFTHQTLNTNGAWQQLVHPDDWSLLELLFQSLLENRPDKSEFRIITKNGKECWLWVYGFPVWSEREKRVIRIFGAAQDITGRRREKMQLKTALEEKELLLKEIHHRVKNNLNIISSLIELQMHQIKYKKTTETLREMQNRIGTMSLIHENLYKEENISRIDFCIYAKNLASNLIEAYRQPNSNQIALKIDFQHQFLEIETAIPCGLIINELVSNSIKYAFPPAVTCSLENTLPEIRISFYETDDKRSYILGVSDNGIGLPKNLENRKCSTFGLKLVALLVRQLEGQLEIEHREGISFKITFPRRDYSRRL